MKIKIYVAGLMGLSLFWAFSGTIATNSAFGSGEVVVNKKIDKSAFLEELKKEAMLDIRKSFSRSTNLKHLNQTRIVLLFSLSMNLFGKRFDLKKVMEIFEEVVSEIEKQYEKRKQEIEKRTIKLGIA